MKKITASLALLLLITTPAFAGGGLETVDITAGTPSPIAGHILARAIPIRWDARAIPVPYRMNDSFAMIPNPLGAPFLSLADATAAMQASFDQWNDVPTSYIDMQIVGTTTNAGLVGFNMVNEISFRTAAGFGAIASSPSTSLISDVTLVDGDDLDGDGDSDVSSSITSIADVDGDGDNEFPAGFYKAGTILDNDVQFNTKASNGFRFTVADADADTVTRSVDLMCVAVHEFGHSFGLSHVLNNQDSDTDGNGATMFPLIDTGDPASELSQRTPNADDLAWVSYFYPEGTASSGPAALQAGDVAFDKRYGLIQGEIRHGMLNVPIAGASVFTQAHSGQQRGPSAFSGTANLSFNPATGGLFFIPLANIDVAIVDGKYTIPVEKGNWNVGVEALDGSPVAANQVSFTTQIGNFYGQMTFNEEFWNHNQEGVLERRPGQKKNVNVKVGKTESNVNITTNATNLNINPFGNRTNIGFINPPAGGFIYAVRIPAAQIQSIRPGLPIWVTSALFDSNVVDASAPVVFAEAMLTTGSVSGSTANINLTTPLYREAPFVGQETDFSPLFVKNPHDTGALVRTLTDSGVDLFMVVRIPSAPFPGVTNQPPLIGLSSQAPILGNSYLSTDGGVTFNRRNDFNFRFSLTVSEPTN